MNTASSTTPGDPPRTSRLSADGWAGLLRLLRDAPGMGPFVTGLCRVTLRAVAEGRDFAADLDEFLAEYQQSMVAAGIEPQRARTTLLELRALVIEAWNAGRAAVHGGI